MLLSGTLFWSLCLQTSALFHQWSRTRLRCCWMSPKRSRFMTCASLPLPLPCCSRLRYPFPLSHVLFPVPPFTCFVFPGTAASLLVVFRYRGRRLVCFQRGSPFHASDQVVVNFLPADVLSIGRMELAVLPKEPSNRKILYKNSNYEGSEFSSAGASIYSLLSRACRRERCHPQQS